MKKKSPKSSRGSAKCLTNSPNFKCRNKSPSSASQTGAEISKFFIAENVNKTKTVDDSKSEFESPYKHIVTEPTPFMNNSVEDEQDFKSLEAFKPNVKVLKKDQSNKAGASKRRKRNKSCIKGQTKLTNMIKKQLEYIDTNPEELQMALALSKSEQSSEEMEENIEVTSYLSTQKKLSTVKRTLEQFGFKSNKEVKREEVPKRRKKSKYQFITPILYLRTEEDRRNLIATKISMIQSQNLLPQYSYERETPLVRSQYLSKMFNNTSELFTMNRIHCNKFETDRFYVRELNIERSYIKCGHLLKDWNQIPGREKTPPREIIHKPTNIEIKKETIEVTPNIIIIEDDVSTNIDIDQNSLVEDVEGSRMEKSNLNISEQRSLSPDLFTSDDEQLNEIKRSIDKKLNRSLEIIDHIRSFDVSQTFLTKQTFTEDNNYPKANVLQKGAKVNGISTDIGREHADLLEINVGENKQMQINTQNVSILNNTDDLLATLEINLTKSIEQVVAPKNNDYNASLSSNLNSQEFLNSHNMQTDSSGNSSCELTFANVNGIQHYESFYDKPASQEDIVTLKESDDICITDCEKEESYGRISIIDCNKAPDMHELSDDINCSSKKEEEAVNSVNCIGKPDEIYDLTQTDDEICMDTTNMTERLERNDPAAIDYEDNMFETERIMEENFREKAITKKAKKKYELSESENSETEFGKINDIKNVDRNIKELFESPIIHTKSSESCNQSRISSNKESKIRKSLSFTPISSTKSPKSLKKYATFTTPSPNKNKLLQRSSSTSVSSENSDIICISDEEVNYSAIHCSTYKDCVTNSEGIEEVNTSINVLAEENEKDVSRYSYLEKYYEDQFYLEQNHYFDSNYVEKSCSPIAHPRILELSNKKTPFKEFTSSSPITNTVDRVGDTSTPSTDNVIIKTNNITPMPDYDNMSTPIIGKELEKIGVKHLKRHRGVQILKHIYETTHPICPTHQDNEDSDDNQDIKRQKLMKSKSRRKLVVDSSSNNNLIGNAHTKSKGEQNIEIVGDISESGELIFERKRSKKVLSCAVPLHVAWHNLIASDPELKQNILLYEPLQLEVLDSMLKEQGYKYHIQDLLTFLDKKCITIRINQNNRQSKRRFK